MLYSIVENILSVPNSTWCVSLGVQLLRDKYSSSTTTSWSFFNFATMLKSSIVNSVLLVTVALYYAYSSKESSSFLANDKELIGFRTCSFALLLFWTSLPEAKSSSKFFWLAFEVFIFLILLILFKTSVLLS